MPPRLLRRRLRAARRPSRGRPRLEALEARDLLSTLTVLNLNDSGAGSLRQAILSAAPGDTINFAVTGKITLTSGALAINQDLTISGPGPGALTVSGNNASQVFVIGDVNASIAGLTIADGFFGPSGAGLLYNADSSKTLSLTDCTFSHNVSSAGNGGAFEATGDCPVDVTDCLFVNNSAPGNGAAIDSPGILLNVADSTFAANAAGNGGAISIGNDPVSITNSTLVDNTASGQAGAIFSDFNAAYTLTNCTVAGNSTAGVGGGFSIIGGSITLLNTIVAGNTAGSAPDISGGIISQGHNLIGATDGSGGFVGSDKTGTAAKPLNPLLSPLQDFGGPTPTVALLQGSPALGAGTAAGAPATDQRGDPRFGSFDIGAAQLLDAVVTNTNDSGPGSLRQAILDTNAHPGDDFITFAIPGGGVHVIQPLSPLPDVTDTVVIDGFSQPGSSPNTLAAGDNEVINVEIDGGGMNANGIVLSNVKNSVVRGLSVVGFGNGFTDVGGIAILGQPADNNVITGNFLGVRPDGQTAAGNTDGVILQGDPTFNVIGGTNPADRNVISGNFSWGFLLNAASGTVIAGNFIGLDASGLNALGNGNGGVIDQGFGGNVIGGTTPAARNYIAGNVDRGVKLTIDHTSDAVTNGPVTTGNVIEGNWIGLNVNGVAVGGQTVAGVEVRNVSDNSVGVPGAGNVISGNAGDGVDLVGNAAGNVLAGNLIGTNPAGTGAAGNAVYGVLIDGGAAGNTVGGTAAGAGSVISGNGVDGVEVGGGAGAGNVIQGNLIGLTAAGNAALGNGLHGIQSFANAPLLIGSDSPSGRNVISGNHNHGIALNGGGATIVGNDIGTDATGTFAVGNGASGIGLNAASGNDIGDTTPFGGNVISGNAVSGIEFFNGSNANAVFHNLIGTAADGVTPLGNGRDGVRFLSATLSGGNFGNAIGLAAPGGGNVIAFNPNGVVVDTASTADTISGNSIFGNANLGIVLGPGGNDSQPAPRLTAVGVSSVSGFLVAAPATLFQIEFFASAAGGPAGQGKTFLGSVAVQTDANGHADFSAATAAIFPGQVVTATATATGETDLNGDTSPFSNAFAAPLPLARFLVTPASQNATAGQSVRFTVTALDGNGAVLTNYQGTVAFASAGTDAAPSLPGQFTFTAGDRGVHTFSATYFIAGAQTFGVLDVISGASGTAAVQVSAAAFDHLSLTGLSSGTPIGVQNTVTVEAQDAFGNVVSGFTDTLSFSSNDSLAQLPADARLVNGVGTFAVTFRGLLPTTVVGGQSVRIYTLTVTDPGKTSVTASQTVNLALYLLSQQVQFVKVENVPFTHELVGTFLTDLATGPALSAKDFAATIDWGDGSPIDTGTIVISSDGTTFDVFGDHTYPTGQTDYPVDVTVTYLGPFSLLVKSQPMSPSVAAVVTASQFANLGPSLLVRAVIGQTSLDLNTPGASASLDGADSGLKTTLFVANYFNNPQTDTSIQGVSFYDIRATNPTGGAFLAVTFRFPPGGGLRELEFFDPATGRYVAVVGSTRFAPVDPNAANGTVTIIFDDTSFPRLSQLQGTVFSIVIPPPTAATSTSTQSATLSPALSLALPTAGGTQTRAVSFQASGVAVGLSPSQDVTHAAGRADLSGGGGDDDPTEEDLDFVMQVLGFSGADAAPGVAPAAAPAAAPAVAPAAVPVATPPSEPHAVPAGSTGPGAALPPRRPADAVFAASVERRSDAAFAAAEAEPFDFLPPPPRPGRVPAAAGRAVAPSLLAVPLLGALAAPPLAAARRGRRRAGVSLFLR